MNTYVFAIMSLALISSGFAIGILFSATAFQPSVASSLPEYLLLSETQYRSGVDGWLAMRVNNTGIGSVTLVKILVNYIKQLSVSPTLPVTIAPDQGLFLIISTNLNQGDTYQIDLLTSQGNKFSGSILVPYENQQAGVMLRKLNANFYNSGGVKRIDIDISNAGTEDTQITRLYIGTSTSTLQNQNIAAVDLPHGGIQTVTVNYNWTAGAVYYFKVSATGQDLGPWAEQVPLPEPTEQVSITNMSFETGTPGSIFVVANNTGANVVAINEVWVNNAKQTTTNPALPSNINANAGMTLNITIPVSAGYAYQVKLVSSEGNAFLYTGTAPT